MPKSKAIHFFAAKRDLEGVLAAVESQRRLKYTQAGMFDSPEPIVLNQLEMESLVRSG